MADYAEGPFERVANVGWATVADTYDFTTVLFSNFNSQFIPYTDCSGSPAQLDLGVVMSVIGFELRALTVPPSLPSLSSGQVDAVSLPVGDSLQLTWSGYTCTPQLIQARYSEVAGAGSGTISGVSHPVDVRLFSATYWTGNRFRLQFIVTPGDSVYTGRTWRGAF